MCIRDRSSPTFRGLGNYIEMFTADKQFWKSLTITLKYAAIFVPLNMIIALFLAMLITQPLSGVKIYRTIFYICLLYTSGFRRIVGNAVLICVILGALVTVLLLGGIPVILRLLNVQPNVAHMTRQYLTVRCV